MSDNINKIETEVEISSASFNDNPPQLEVSESVEVIEDSTGYSVEAISNSFMVPLASAEQFSSEGSLRSTKLTSSLSDMQVSDSDDDADADADDDDDQPKVAVPNPGYFRNNFGNGNTGGTRIIVYDAEYATRVNSPIVGVENRAFFNDDISDGVLTAPAPSPAPAEMADIPATEDDFDTIPIIQIDVPNDAAASPSAFIGACSQWKKWLKLAYHIFVGLLIIATTIILIYFYAVCVKDKKDGNNDEDQEKIA